MDGAVHLLTGATGAGKTTLTMNLALALAEGRELWDIPCKQRRVLYVDMENGDVNRSMKLRRLYPDGFQVERQLLFLPPPISLPEQKDELVDFSVKNKIDLVVFDTARRCFAVQDENSNAEFYNRVSPTPDALKSEGIASLILAHPSKHGGAGARGAGAQEDAGDVNLTLTLPNGSGKDATVVLSVTKHRLLGFDVEPLHLKRIGGDRFERVGSMVTDAEKTQEAQTKRQECRDAIVDFMAQQTQPATYTTVIKAMTALGHSQSMTQARLGELVDEKTIIKGNSRYALSSLDEEE